MKTLFSLPGIIAILGLAVASTFAQTQSTTSSTSYIQTSKFIGRPVKSAQGDEIGTVKDIVLDRSTGCLAYTVLSTTGGGGGAQVSGGGKMVAVPWAVYSPSTDPNVLTVTVERDRIYNAPVFDYARVEEYSRPDYINNVYSYYGVSGGAAVGVGVSGGTSTTTTGASTTTGATTTTGAATGANTTAGAASPAGASVSGSAAPNAAEGRRAHPGAAAAAGAAAVRARETATPSLSERAGERTPSAKQKQGKPTPPSSRSETGTRSESAKAPSEQTATGEKATGSQRREKGKRETKPSEKPPGD
jgi:sporulation protein YlmC with PRC-barrel domain